MTGLLASSPCLAAVLATTIALAPPVQDPADASPESAPAFAEPPPAPEPGPAAEPDAELDEPLRIVASEPAPAPEPEAIAPQPITLAEPPPPAIESPPPAPVHRTVSERRPMSGNGLLAMGIVSMSASSIMLITALAGPGWGDMSRGEAAIAGGAGIAVGVFGAAMVVGGVKSKQKYRRWAERNSVYPPDTGNGMLVAGGVVTLLGTAGIAGGTQRAITKSNPTRGDWAIVGVSGVATTLGLVVLGGGMINRSKFAAWERHNLAPGPMALRGGAGLTISGRF